MSLRIRPRLYAWENRRRVVSMARQVAAHSQEKSGVGPVVLFNASARLTGLSLNAAFSLLTSWGMRLAGAPVVHFVCQAGMSHCVQGTNREDYHAPPPCADCIAQSRRLNTHANVHWFKYQPDPELAAALAGLSMTELGDFKYSGKRLTISNTETDNRKSKIENRKFAISHEGAEIPLGSLVLPSLRWALRRYELPDDKDTRYLMRAYIQSAENIARQISAFLDEVKPSVVVIFNGILYPEAIARWVAQQHGIRVITYEVAFQPYSAFFTDGEATAYPIHIPDDFELSPEQNVRLDGYLAKRFQGDFTMAGIRFWPEMHGLDEAFLQKVARFKQLVPVFTNVVYDTSQVHANRVFSHMFAWLELALELMRAHPETLFVIRSHPDEMRPGTRKQSRQSVRAWVAQTGAIDLENVIYIDSQEYINSYELIQRSKFVMVYNSSIGMEAAILGVPVLCGGKARYTQYPMVFLPASPQAYREQAEDFLAAQEIAVPPEFSHNARRFLYYQLFRAALPFEAYLESGGRLGFVNLKPFSWHDLLVENSPTMKVILDGILRPGDSVDERFLMPDQS